MRLADLMELDVKGWTLVEYKMGRMMNAELGRARILEVSLQGGMFSIKTDAPKSAHLTFNLGLCEMPQIYRDGLIFRFQSPMGWWYAIAPPGRDVPLVRALAR